ELLEEVEEVLDIQMYPMNWPAGMGKNFLGIFDRQGRQFIQYNGNEQETAISYENLEQPEHEKLTSNATYEAAAAEFELVAEAGDSFSLDAVLAGEQTPVFFGSALRPF